MAWVDAEDKHHDEDNNQFVEKDGGGGSAAPDAAGKDTGASKEIPDTPSKPYNEYLNAHKGDHFEAAKDFYRTEFQGKKVTAKLGDLGEKDVHFTGGGWTEVKRYMKNDALKAELVSHIPDILRTGEYLGSKAAFKEHWPYMEFHYFSKETVTTFGKKHVIVDVGKRDDGAYEYNIWSLNHEGHQSFAAKLNHFKRKGNSAELPFGANSRDDRSACPGHYTSTNRYFNSAPEGIPSINVHPAPEATASSPASDVPRIDQNHGTINIYIVGEEAGSDRPVSQASYPGASNRSRKNNIAQTEEENESASERFTYNQRIANWRVDEDGMLRVTAHILREGVYDYAPEECLASIREAFRGLPVIKQYIPASEFTAEALQTLEGKWVIVAAHAWRTDENTMTDGLTVGSVAGAPRLSADGKAIECDMLIADRETAEAIKRGELVEVSAGYNGGLDKESGEFEGVHYDAVQREISFNHVLLLPAGKGRCGSKVRIINARRQAAESGNTEKQPREVSMKEVIHKIRIGNSERTLRFTNEEDAKEAESAMEEQKKFNAEEIAGHIQARESVQAAEAKKQLEALQATLAEHDKALSDARAEIDRLLTPEAQEELAGQLASQKDDEESIVEVEAENCTDEEKEKVLNSIREGRTLAGRRMNAAKWFYANKKIELPASAGQAFYDGIFHTAALSARERIKAHNGRRVLNGKPSAFQDMNRGKSDNDRILDSWYPNRNKEE